MPSLFSELLEALQEYYERISRGEDVKKDEFKRMVVERLQALRCSREKLDLVNQLVDEIVAAEKELGSIVLEFRVRLSSFGLVGASSGLLHAALEVGTTWDYVVDLPVLPSSSVKGALRSTMLKLCARLGDSGKRRNCVKPVYELLGSPEGLSDAELRELAELLGLDKHWLKEGLETKAAMSTVIVYDVYLCREGGRLLEGWVITPHYREALDEYSVRPVPVVHAVLSPGLEGRLVVALRPGSIGLLRDYARYVTEATSYRLDFSEPPERFAAYLMAYLVAAALSSGVGARTTRGYSRFEALKVILHRYESRG